MFVWSRVQESHWHQAEGIACSNAAQPSTRGSPLPVVVPALQHAYHDIFIRDHMFVSTKIHILAEDLQIPSSVISSLKVVSFDVSSQRGSRCCVFESPSDAWRRSDATIHSIKHRENHSKFVREWRQKQTAVQQEKLQRSSIQRQQ